MSRKNIIFLIAILILPFVAFVHNVGAVNYNCSGSMEQAKTCLKLVINERDSTIQSLMEKKETLIKKSQSKTQDELAISLRNLCIDFRIVQDWITSRDTLPISSNAAWQRVYKTCANH